MATRSSIRIIGLSIVFAALTATAAQAQDDRRVGIVAAFPTSIGVQWQVTDRFALRVDGAYSHSSTEINSGEDIVLTPGGIPLPTLPSINVETESTSNTTSFSISGLFTVHQRAEFRLYIAPRFAMSWAQSKVTSTATLTGLPPELANLFVPRDLETSATSPGGGASLGASTRVGERFGIFGEAGFHYSRSTQERELFEDEEQVTNAFGTRAAVGVIVFF